MRIAYLDNAATAPVYKEAADAAYKVLNENFGNPSSLHTLGIEAEQIIDNARLSVSRLLSCDKKEIIFTSGGTESNNLAISGAVSALKRRGKRIITTAIEHPSVINVFKQLEEQGFEAVYVNPRSDGKIYSEDIIKEINDKTILISCMLVNNETGLILPVKEIKQGVINAKAPALIHCDAVQALSKLTFSVRELGVDLLAVSAHKIHGPKGVGALYIKKGARILPIIYGGGQERNLRPGTENTAGIAGFAAACFIVYKNINENISKVRDVREYFAKKIKIEIPQIKINSPNDSVPHIINITVLGFKSETMLHFLESKGVFVSSGSACSSHKKGVSYVLKAMGLKDNEADCALRISFSHLNTKEDIDMLVSSLKEGMSVLTKKD